MDPLSMSNVSVETQAAHVAAAVAAVAQMQHEHLQQQHQHQQQQLSPNNNSHSAVAMEQEDIQENLVNLTDMQEIEEIQEDIVSIPKEVILISLVSQEQALYNPKHEHYRNTQRKDAKWLDIAENVGWSETQCKAKWKAMRDQYCRELKRSKFNAKANVKWKYFKELDFLRPYALSRNYRPRNSINISNNNNNTNNSNNNSITTILPNNTTALSNVVNNNNNISTNHNNNNNISTNHNNNNNRQDIKFPNIKIEAGQFNAEEYVTGTHIKANSRLIDPLTDDQLNVMQQQQQQHDGNWNYITTATTTAALTRNSNELHINNSSGSNNSNNLHATATTATTTTATTAADDALYNSFVAQITQQNNILVTAAGQLHQQHMQQQQQQTQMQQGVNAVDEEDDDPIHTFLNYESYFEKELITMIQQEDILYNSFHPNYRNVKMKLEVWDEIARKLKKTVKQCRLKWKALRDQYIREHKRLKNRENPESLPRWKHYDALSFLQKFIKHKSCDLEKNLIEIPKTEIDIDMDEVCIHSVTVSPMHMESDLQRQQQQLQQQLQQALPTLSGPHNVINSSTQQVQNTLQQQLQQSLQQQATQLLKHQHQGSDEHDESLCGGDVSGYDEMDINDYIIGDADDGAGATADDEDIDDDDDEDIDRKSRQFPVYSPHVDAVAHSNDDHEANDGLQHQHIEFKVSHDSSLTQAQTPNSHSLSQQSTALQQHLQQHQQHIIDIDTDDNTEHHQHNEQNFAEALQASLLNGGTVTTTATTTAPTAASNNEALHVVAVGNAAGSSSNSHNAGTSNASTPSSNDDDEVGAFFKAVAMKIRNAKMSPVAFTDLQIDILRVINGTLRNH